MRRVNSIRGESSKCLEGYLLITVLCPFRSQMISMQLMKSVSNLYTFGIYGRDFAKDGMDASSATSFDLANFYVILIISMWGLIYFG